MGRWPAAIFIFPGYLAAHDLVAVSGMIQVVECASGNTPSYYQAVQMGERSMKHEEILKQLVAESEDDANVFGFLLFGSLATGTHREESDIDVITLFQSKDPAWGITNTNREGIKVGSIYFTTDIMGHSVKNVPYLLHPFVEARLLIDRDGTIEPTQERIRSYFEEHPEIVEEWNGYYQQLKEEKAKYGYEKTTIIDVWNEMEKRHSGGKTKRRFFNAFYLTSPRIFSVLKRFL